MSIPTKSLVSLIIGAYKKGRTDSAEAMGEGLERARQEVKRHQTIAEGLEQVVAKGVQNDWAPAILAERKRCLQIVMLTFGNDRFHSEAKKSHYGDYENLLTTIQSKINSGEVPRG